MLRSLRVPPRRNLTTKSRRDVPSFGFSGAGFLGCYQVGAAACLRRHGRLPLPDDVDAGEMPLLTGVSAGSMVAAAIRAGVDPDPDGMEVVLEAARRTRALTSRRKRRKGPEEDGKSPAAGPMEGFPVSLDVFTPGFSLIDQVEGAFRDAMAKALGGYCEKEQSNNVAVRDIDPDLFARRFPEGSLRIGLTDRRCLWPPLPKEKFWLDAYRYVDTYRNVEDVIACSMLSSYIPGITGPLSLEDKVPPFFGGMLKSDKSDKTDLGVDASSRAGTRLKEMTQLGLVKHGKTGLPIEKDTAGGTTDGESGDDAIERNELTRYWDGGIADAFPTFDDNTVIVVPVNGMFGPNPSISPQMPADEHDATTVNAIRGDADSPRLQQQYSQPTALLQAFLWPYLPTKFRFCPKAELGLNSKNAQAVLDGIFSSDDDELYLRFREGYDDARRYLIERSEYQVFCG